MSLRLAGLLNKVLVNIWYAKLRMISTQSDTLWNVEIMHLGCPGRILWKVFMSGNLHDRNFCWIIPSISKMRLYINSVLIDLSPPHPNWWYVGSFPSIGMSFIQLLLMKQDVSRHYAYSWEEQQPDFDMYFIPSNTNYHFRNQTTYCLRFRLLRIILRTALWSSVFHSSSTLDSVLWILVKTGTGLAELFNG